MNARQRARKHARRRRHANEFRSAPGYGAPASVPPGARQVTRGKVQPAVRRLATVHDMAKAARGRDDVERAWRRAFKGVHSIGYKSDGSMSTAGMAGRAAKTPDSVPRASRSGSVKRRHRAHWGGAHRRDQVQRFKAQMTEAIGQRAALYVQGYQEIAPGHWRPTGQGVGLTGYTTADDWRIPEPPGAKYGDAIDPGELDA